MSVSSARVEAAHYPLHLTTSAMDIIPESAIQMIIDSRESQSLSLSIFPEHFKQISLIFKSEVNNRLHVAGRDLAHGSRIGSGQT